MAEEHSEGVVEQVAPKPPGEEQALREEKTRGQITKWSLIIFGITIVAGFVGMYTGYWTETKEWLQIVLPVESILVGGVAGYYLGTGNTA